jgi:hypothetical protein
LRGTEAVRFLRAYGAKGLDLTHLEYARLARSLRDLAVRIVNAVDLESINTWGFDGLRRVDVRATPGGVFLRGLQGNGVEFG